MRTNTKILRLKKNIYLFKENKYIVFQKSLREGYKLKNDCMLMAFLELIENNHNWNSLVKEIHSKTNWNEKKIGKFINHLIDFKLIEFYDENVIYKNDKKYLNQVLFMDSIFPVSDYSEVLNINSSIQYKHIALIGIGGIGTQIIQSLTYFGIKDITIVDGDLVEESNLNRQIYYNEKDVGKFKVDVLEEKIKNNFSDITVNKICKHINSKDEIKSIVKANSIDFVIIGADLKEIPYWFDELQSEMDIPYGKASYITYSGLIGPILDQESKKFSEIVGLQETIFNDHIIDNLNTKMQHPSIVFFNAIIANIFCLELIKYFTNKNLCKIYQNRLVLDIKENRIYNY